MELAALSAQAMELAALSLAAQALELAALAAVAGIGLLELLMLLLLIVVVLTLEAASRVLLVRFQNHLLPTPAIGMSPFSPAIQGLFLFGCGGAIK